MCKKKRRNLIKLRKIKCSTAKYKYNVHVCIYKHTNAFLLQAYAVSGFSVYLLVSNVSFIYNVSYIHYRSYSWHPETKKPMHREVGFIRRKPNTNIVAFLIAQNLGK